MNDTMQEARNYLKISETAELLGVTRQTIYSKITELNIDTVDIEGVNHLSRDGIEKIKNSLSYRTQKKTGKQHESLTKQIELLNEQIQILQQQNEYLKGIITTKDEQIGQLLHVQNLQTQKALEEPKKEGFFSRLFGTGKQQ